MKFQVLILLFAFAFTSVADAKGPLSMLKGAHKKHKKMHKKMLGFATFGLLGGKKKKKHRNKHERTPEGIYEEFDSIANSEAEEGVCAVSSDGSSSCPPSKRDMLGLFCASTQGWTDPEKSGACSSIGMYSCSKTSQRHCDGGRRGGGAEELAHMLQDEQKRKKQCAKGKQKACDKKTDFSEYDDLLASIRKPVKEVLVCEDEANEKVETKEESITKPAGSGKASRKLGYYCASTNGYENADKAALCKSAGYTACSSITTDRCAGGTSGDSYNLGQALLNEEECEKGAGTTCDGKKPEDYAELVAAARMVEVVKGECKKPEVARQPASETVIEGVTITSGVTSGGSTSVR